jgi:aquaglyceroporin related protein
MIVMVLAVFRGFPAKRIPVYIFVQVLGAFIGALLAFAVHKDAIYHLDGALLSETTGVNFYTQPQNEYISVSTAFSVEMLGSAVIACTILALGDSGNSPPGAGMHAFIIGLLITTTCMALGWTTRGCFNPARDLGPRLAAIAVGYPLHSFTDWSNFWIWGAWVAPMTGGLIGGIAYDACIFKGGESPINYSGQLWKKKTKRTEAGFFANVMHDTAKAQDIDRQLEEGDLRTTESGNVLDAGSPSTLYEEDEQQQQQHQQSDSLAR